MNDPSLESRYRAALALTEYIAGARKNKGLWEAVYRTARVEADAVVRASALAGAPTGPRHLLVLSEDWCGDAVNAVPVVARLADEVPDLDLRVLARDEKGQALEKDERYKEVRRWYARDRGRTVVREMVELLERVPR